MKYTTYYTNVERVEYEFDQNDLVEILVKHLTGKSRYQSEGKWDIESEDEWKKDEEFPTGWHIKLTHKLEKAAENKEKE